MDCLAASSRSSSSCLRTSTEWKYDVKFTSRQPVDIETWHHPIKLNRTDLKREPESRDGPGVGLAVPIEPMLGLDGKPVIGVDGKPGVLWRRHLQLREVLCAPRSLIRTNEKLRKAARPAIRTERLVGWRPRSEGRPPLMVSWKIAWRSTGCGIVPAHLSVTGVTPVTMSRPTSTTEGCYL